MGKAIRASMLVLLFACSAQAGYIQNDSPAPPPSQPALAVQGPTTNGQIDTGATAPTADGETPNNATTFIIEIVLNLLALP